MLKGYLLYRWVAQLFTWGSAVWCVNVSELAAYFWSQCASIMQQLVKICQHASKHEDRLPASALACNLSSLQELWQNPPGQLLTRR